MKVDIIDDQNKCELDFDVLEKTAAYIGNKFDISEDTGLNIIFIEKDQIRGLNRQHRSIDSATDVLSFSYVEGGGLEDEDGFKTIGEIYICPEIAQKNASQIKGAWHTTLEMILLIIHGILHIYDYDHEVTRERLDMETAQKSLMNDIRQTFSI